MGGNTDRMPFSSPARGGAGSRLVTDSAWLETRAKMARTLSRHSAAPVLTAVGAEGGCGDVVLGVVDGGGQQGGRGQRPGFFDQPGRYPAEQIGGSAGGPGDEAGRGEQVRKP